MIYHGDALDAYASWPTPVAIVSDGAYGVGGFPGDPRDVGRLPAWYRPHVAAWSARATPQTTLWFWNTEIGWATVAPLLAEHGWQYVACHTWDKGLGHVAGNANTKTLRRLPCVTEVCVQYVRPPLFRAHASTQWLTAQQWLRAEWRRAGLTLQQADEACGVANAASRKYLAADDKWYLPPPEMFARLSVYAQAHGHPEGRPYFSLNSPHAHADAWARMRAKFHCPFGVTNVWHEPPLRGAERVKVAGRVVHANQKPLRLLEQILEMSTDPGDDVWEPFGGLCSVAVAARQTARVCHSAETDAALCAVAEERLARVAADG